jgi:L-2-hydroxyglutarate oxidase
MVRDIIVIGGGIVGLATALRVKHRHPNASLVLIEKENGLALHQTGNNSGVIHSGIYYKPGSLKAVNCLRGYHMLIDFCRRHEIPFDLCGKIIVATQPAEIPLLNNLFIRGQQNGLRNLRKLRRDEIREREPYVSGLEGIFVPQTGIVDYTRVAHAFAEEIKRLDGTIVLGERVIDVQKTKDYAVVVTQRQSYQGKLVINCAGLYSDKIARLTMPRIDFKIIPFRGEYYKFKRNREYLVKNLVYPVPDPNFPFLGVHFTRMAKGGVEAGPNAVLAFAREGYRKSTINFSELAESLAWPGFQKVARKYWQTGMSEMYRSFSKEAFTQALRKLIPEIDENDLEDGGAGVRAQACSRQGGLIDDFLILEDKLVINVCNAPSPAATSALSIGETIAEMALAKLA